VIAHDEDEMRRLAASVGFLTAGSRRTLSSAILLSSDPNLVYLFGPENERTPDGLALGFRIHNPMFWKHLIWQWAYGLAAEHKKTLREFPGLLKSESDFGQYPGVDGNFCNGFDAAFVGAAAPPVSGRPGVVTSMGDFPIHDFFPLGRGDARKFLAEFRGANLLKVTLSPRLANMTLGEVIPDVPIGGQFDDIRRFWNPGFTCQDCAGIFLQIETKTPEGLGVIKQGRLADLDEAHPIRQYLSDSTGLFVGAPGRGSHAPVNWAGFMIGLEEIAKKLDWLASPIGGVISDDCYYKVKALVERLSGAEAPHGSFVYTVAYFSQHCPEAEFERRVEDLFKSLGVDGSEGE
jgi:hypothetical protein